MSVNSRQKPLAGISMDLDDKWAYMKAHNDKGWEVYPSYIGAFLPQILKLLGQLNLKITFFLVGKDAARPQNQNLLRALTVSGHEVANHSYHHDPFFLTHTKDNLRKEILQAEEAIQKATGVKPIGFRGPGFTWRRSLLETLAELGYTYDASILPTFIGPLARKAFFAQADLTETQKRRLKALYGNLKNGFLPISPFSWRTHADVDLLEVPVTTMPIFKFPLHMTYLMYLGSYSTALMCLYLKTALGLLKVTRTPLSFLLHPLDLMGADKVPELSYFPGMGLTSKEKTRLFTMIIGQLKSHFTVVPLNQFAARFTT